MITVNDLIGLNYSNLRNPTGVQTDFNQNKPVQDTTYNSTFSLMPDPNFPKYAERIDTNLTPLSDVNKNPISINTTGISPILQQDMDYGTSVDNFQGFTDKQDFSRPTPVKQGGGLNSLLQLALSVAIPGAGLLLNAPRGLAGLNRRFRQNVTDFFDRRKYGGKTRDEAYADMITQTRGIQKQMALRPSGQVTAQDKYRGGASSQNEAANRSAAKASAQKASRSAGISSARGSNYGSRFHG